MKNSCVGSYGEYRKNKQKVITTVKKKQQYCNTKNTKTAMTSKTTIPQKTKPQHL